MPIYDASNFDPPAPVALVTLRNPHSGAVVSDVALLLDTGADITLLPRSAVEQIGVSLLGGERYELVGFDGSRSFAGAAFMDVLFLNRAFRGRYLLVEANRGILGRDILNHLSLLFDGPQQKWSQQALG